jgi:hypothetical protein
MQRRLDKTFLLFCEPIFSIWACRNDAGPCLTLQAVLPLRDRLNAADQLGRLVVRRGPVRAHDSLAGAHGSDRRQRARANGRKVRIVPRLDLEDGINAVRLMLERTWIDAERCKRGLECLQNYRRDFNDKLGEFKASPVHDWASHGADSARYLALGLRERNTAPVPSLRRMPSLDLAGPQSWMA